MEKTRRFRALRAPVDSVLQVERCEGTRILGSRCGRIGLYIRRSLLGDDERHPQSPRWLGRSAIRRAASDRCRFSGRQTPRVKFRKAVGDGGELGVEQYEVLLGRARIVFEIGVDASIGIQIGGVDDEAPVVRRKSFAGITAD